MLCRASALACLLGAAGCSAEAATELDELGSTGTVQQAISGAYRQSYVSYDATKWFSEWPANEQFCMLTGVRGDTLTFKVTGGNNTGWKAVANDETAGWVTCFPVDNFKGPAGSVYMVSGDADECETEGNRNCWWGDAATFLRWVEGRMYGGGEYVRVFQSTLANSPSTVVPYNSSALGSAQGAGKSIFFGVPGGKRLVRLMGYTSSGSAKGTVTTSGTFLMSVSTYSGYQSYWLSPTDAGFCGLTKVGGEFNGGGEIARISPTEGWWFLDSIAGSGDVWASSRCMAWNQN